MNLVVTGDTLAAVVDHTAGGAYAFATGADRDGATHQPDPVTAGLDRQKILHWPPAVVLGRRQALGVAAGHEPEVLRQRHQPRAVGGGPVDERGGGGEVGVDIGARHHLHGGDAGHGRFPPVRTSRRSGPPAAGSRSSNTRAEGSPKLTSQARNSSARSCDSSLAA